MTAFDADVMIVGGGPAGVAAAVELRRQQVQKVMLLEREPALGGATRHCLHSPFGMREFGRIQSGPAYARRLARHAHDAGVKMCTGYSVIALEQDGRLCVRSNHGVQWLRARRIIVATGARELPRPARLLSGDRPMGVLTTGTLQAAIAFHHRVPFFRPLIVGSELVSLSALLTCLSHGIKPVAMIEPRPHALAGKPWAWFPALTGKPLRCHTALSDIIGKERVEAVTLDCAGKMQTLACDGVLLTGQFIPESALFRQSPMGVADGSAGPLIDQYGRSLNPLYFSAGNVLRAVETGGWAYREGRAVANTVAADLRHAAEIPIPNPVTFDAPIKLVVPGMLRTGTLTPAFRQFQLRMLFRVRGELGLQLDGRTVWKRHATWWPERRITIPIPAQAQHARRIHVYFREDTP